MPDKTALTLKSPENAQLMDYIRDRQGSDYAQRVPAATQAGVAATFERMWENDVTRNQFVSALVNLIGLQLVRATIWKNPLAPFKKGLLTYGDTIEEIMVGLRDSYVYDTNRDYLEKAIFGSEPNEVQTAFHKVNRTNWYKLTIQEDLLKRAFLPGGNLGEFVAALMSSMYTSDQWDEFLLMSKIFSLYEREEGFYKVNVPDLTDLTSSDAAPAKRFIKTVRALLDTLPFVSREYNARHMPVAADPGKLLLITTPEAKANMDVEALAAAFNIEMSQIATKMIVLPARYIKIKGFQALLTTEDFFVVADQKLETRSVQNPVGLITNYFLHHWQVISASPFVPAILLTSEPVDATQYTDPAISGLSPITLWDEYEEGVEVTTVERGSAVFAKSTAQFNADDASNLESGVVWDVEGNSSTYTRITQTGILFAGYNESASSLKIIASSSENPEFKISRNIGVTGDLVRGSIGLSVDSDPSTLAIVHLPQISSNTGNNKVGSIFSASPGEWDAPIGTPTYQWKLDGTPINGATNESYTSQPGDASKALTVTVTATALSGGAAKNSTSRPVALVAAS